MATTAVTIGWGRSRFSEHWNGCWGKGSRVWYLWRMCEADRWMVLDASRYTPDDGTEVYQFHAEAKAEAERRNSTRPHEAQGRLEI